jgi:cbb3-type cytochrome oxidase maturation protein
LDILFLTLPLALLLALIFIGIFIYSVKAGQYDDLETPSYKMLLEDEKIISSKKSENKNLKEKVYE